MRKVAKKNLGLQAVEGGLDGMAGHVREMPFRPGDPVETLKGEIGRVNSIDLRGVVVEIEGGFRCVPSSELRHAYPDLDVTVGDLADAAHIARELLLRMPVTTRAVRNQVQCTACDAVTRIKTKGQFSLNHHADCARVRGLALLERLNIKTSTE